MNDTIAIVVWAAPRRKQPQPSRSRAKRPEPQPRFDFQKWRDPILFFSGLLGVVVLTVAWLYGKPIPEALLIFFGAMMALPLPLRADEARRNGAG
jgi:hypothetical protein